MTAPRVTKKVIDQVCELIADGASLRSICEREDMPDRRNIMRAIAKNEAWAAQYTQACALRTEAWADDIVYAASTPQEGIRTKVGPKGTETITGDMVERSRLEVDAKKWIVSKLLPKKYGDRLNVDHGVQASLADLVMQSMEPPASPPPAPDASGD